MTTKLEAAEPGEEAARLRNTLSAATKPPGVILIPLMRMEGGPSSESANCDSPEFPAVATVLINLSLLVFRVATPGWSAEAVVVAAAGVVVAITQNILFGVSL
ncbi:MAG: hypothetical protein ABSG69_08150 [Candidatus Acidiferrum sp.]